jgi:hypothetical protein
VRIRNIEYLSVFSQKLLLDDGLQKEMKDITNELD